MKLFSKHSLLNIPPTFRQDNYQMKLQVPLVRSQYVHYLVSFCLAFFSLTLAAQSNDQSDLFSKLYFPFDFGFSFNSNANLDSGTLAKAGVEYRFKAKNGYFVRLSIDNRYNNYEIVLNETTNVTKGRVNFTDYTIGLGHRWGKNKTRTFFLGQAGISYYEYPAVDGSSPDFEVINAIASAPVIKLVVGLEYYIARDAALTLEAGQYFHFDSSVFWRNDNLSTNVISLGLTTTLF